MSHRNILEMEEKAKEILELAKELQKMAEENNFSFHMTSERIVFDDWLSSDCFGEGTSEEFGVTSAGDVWHSSAC